MRSTSAERPHRSGFEILADLAEGRRLPTSRAEERAALDALSAFEGGATEADPALAERIRTALEGFDRRDTRLTLGWITGPPRRWRWLAPLTRRRRQRHLLLFVLLAKTVAQVYRFEVLALLNAHGIRWGERGIQDLLDWIPRRFVTRSGRELALAYFELAGRLLPSRGDLHGRRDPEGPRLLNRDEVDVGTFVRWPWTRQLMHLVAWREERASRGWRPGPGPAPNPVVVAGTIEFQLARRRAYGGIRRRGGSLARVVLSRLGYEDVRRQPAAWPWREALMAAVSVAAAVGAVRVLVLRASAWDTANDSAAREITEYLEQHASDPRPAPPDPGGTSADAPLVASQEGHRNQETNP